MNKKKIRLTLVLDEDLYYGLKTNAGREVVAIGPLVRHFLQKNDSALQRNEP